MVPEVTFQHPNPIDAVGCRCSTGLSLEKSHSSDGCTHTEQLHVCVKSHLQLPAQR